MCIWDILRTQFYVSPIKYGTLRFISALHIPHTEVYVVPLDTRR